MSIIIETEKVVNDKNEIGRKITKVKMLPSNKLPESYKQEEMWCAYLPLEKAIKIYNRNYTTIRICRLNNFITEEIYKKMIEKLNICGNNLRDRNKINQALKLTWNGTETITI